MLGLNVFSMFVFLTVNLYASRLCTYSEKRRNRHLRVLCGALLLLNLNQYAPLSVILWGKLRVPVEFSSIASFSVPIIMFTGFKKLKCWAAYSGIMAGFFYYITMIISGGKIYGTWQPHEVYMSLFCHGTLYLYGLVSLRTQEFELPDCFTLLAGVDFVVLNAALLRPVADVGTRLFIYELLDGVYIRKLFQETLWGYLTPIYYVLLVGGVLLSVRLFLKLNKAQYKKYTKTLQECQPVLHALV